MSLFQIILKQLRQRSLSTVLTILSVALGVALATAIIIIQREGDKLFGQTDFGFDIIVGPKGSKLQLVLNNVYQVTDAQSTIPYHVYTDLATRLRGDVKWAVPIATGDTYRGHKILATQPKLFETPELAAARATVQQIFAKTRNTISRFENPAQLPTLPVAPNDVALPQLFTIQQEMDDAAKIAGAFDPEVKSLLESASTDAMTMVDLLATSSDKTQIVTATNRLLDQVGGAVALIGGPIEPRPGESFTLASGQSFAADKFECVIGADVAKKLEIKLGDALQASHGASEANETGHDHAEKWVVVGILKPTQTAFDRVILIPLTGFFSIPDHGKALHEMASKTAEFTENIANDPQAIPATQAVSPGAPPETEAEHHDDHDSHDEHDHTYHLENGKIILEVPKNEWKINSILVRSRGGQSAMSLTWNYNQTPEAMAVNPASEMREFTNTFLRGSSLVLLLLAILVSVVAAVSILVSIYNSIASRRREIAILRALGATKTRILTIICLEAGLIGLIGSTIGLLMGMSLAAAASVALHGAMGEGLNWLRVSLAQGLYFVAAIALSIIAGLVPALKAYSTSVAENLVAD